MRASASELAAVIAGEDALRSAAHQHGALIRNDSTGQWAAINPTTGQPFAVETSIAQDLVDRKMVRVYELDSPTPATSYTITGWGALGLEVLDRQRAAGNQ